MKTSTACFALFIFLNLSQRGDAQFLDDSCKTSTPTQEGAWVVILLNKTQLRCAGSLINSQLVLTAAECIEGQGTLFALLGAKHPSHPKSVIAAKQGRIHRSYSRESGLNNIGLVILSQRVQYTDQVGPICILKSMPLHDLEKIRSFQTFGWGIGTDREISNNRTEICIGHFNRLYCDIGTEQSYFCGGPTQDGCCGGDIGGPLSSLVTLNAENKYPVQFGLESYRRGKCGGVRPYIDVTSYADWIEGIVQDTKIQRPKATATEEMLLIYSSCGEIYLTANIYGPDFMAKGVMITHRFVLTTAQKLTEVVSSLRVGVQGQRHYEELEIDSVYNHPDGLNTDLALLKLASELIPEDIMKPICILTRPPVKQSLSQLTVLDIDRKETFIKHSFKLASSIGNRSCSAGLSQQLKPSEICVRTPSGLKQVFGIRGNVVSQKIMNPGKNATIHPLFGIVKYSESGINIITDVSLHANWIASVVRENSVEDT